MLPILLFVVAAWQAFGVIVTISNVGKKREPTTGGVAAFATVVSAGIIFVVVWAAVSLS